MCRGSASGKGPFVCSCRQILRSKSIQTEDKDIQIGGDKFQYQIVLIDMDLHEESKGLQKNVQFGPLDFIRFHWGQVILGILCVNRWQVNITNNHIIRVSSGLNNTIRVTISKYQIYPDKPCGPTLSAVTNKRHGYCRFWPIRIRCRRPGPGKENIWPIGLRFAFENLLEPSDSSLGKLWVSLETSQQRNFVPTTLRLEPHFVIVSQSVTQWWFSVLYPKY